MAESADFMICEFWRTFAFSEHRNTQAYTSHFSHTSHTNHSCIREEALVSMFPLLSSVLPSSRLLSIPSESDVQLHSHIIEKKRKMLPRAWNHCSVHSKHILTVWVTSSSSAYISSVAGTDDLCPPLLIGDLCLSSDLWSEALNLFLYSC